MNFLFFSQWLIYCEKNVENVLKCHLSIMGAQVLNNKNDCLTLAEFLSLKKITTESFLFLKFIYLSVPMFACLPFCFVLLVLLLLFFSVLFGGRVGVVVLGYYMYVTI